MPMLTWAGAEMAGTSSIKGKNGRERMFQPPVQSD